MLNNFTPQKNIALKHVTILFLVIMVLLTCCFNRVARAELAGELTAAELEQQHLLQLYSYKLWQRINEVRSNPSEQLTALGIDIDQAATALGDKAWLLEQGLPPLVWNDQVANAAQLHAQDMVSRLYYSKTSPEGLDAQQRVEAQGYEAGYADEALALLAFSNFMPIDEAVEILLQNVLRDEIYMASATERTIFSIDYTVVGIAFKAEKLEQLTGQNYVYLLVADVAEPQREQNWLVGVAAPQTQIAFRDYYTGFWHPISVMLSGGFQQQIGDAGGELCVFDSEGKLLLSRSVYPDSTTVNYIDWRNL
jgi:hypothetical protein